MSIVVAGGGLAGSAAACRLAGAGRAVTLIEREAGPAHKVCGEFLSREACLLLGRLGVDALALGGAPITALRLSRGAAVATAPLGFTALGLSRRVLDEALLGRAAAAGATVLRGEPIRAIRTGDDLGVEIGGREIAAGTLLLATGKHEIRGARRPVRDALNDLVGFKMHYRLAANQQAALAGHVELMLFADGYAGLQPIESGQATLCLLVHRARLARAGGWTALRDDLCQDNPHLAARLRGAVAQFDRPLTIARVPYGYVHRVSRADDPRLFRLGDQAAVIPSFTGDGMSIALHSAALAAEHVLLGRSASAYHRTLRRDCGGQIGRAGALFRLGATGPGQSMVMRLARVLPDLLTRAAGLTRLPEAALARALAPRA